MRVPDSREACVLTCARANALGAAPARVRTQYVRCVRVRIRAFQNSSYSKTIQHFHLGNHPMADNKVVDAQFVLESLAEDKEEHFGPIEVCLP